MFISVSALPPRARLACQHAVHARALGGAASSVLVRHRQQTREFRFGWWADRFDHDHHREVRRRLRGLRYKNCEDFRNASWDQQPHTCESPRSFKRHAKHYDQQPKRYFAFSRYGGPDRFEAPDSAAGARPGQNIEDVERAAWGSFLFGDQNLASQQRQSWVASFGDMRSYISQRQSDILKEAALGKSAPSRAKAEADDDYVIDPITNRKVFKSSIRSPLGESGDIPGSTTFKSYRSKFSPSKSAAKASETLGPMSFDEPLASSVQPTVITTYDADLPPTADELRAYGKVEIDDIESSPQKAAAGSRSTGTTQPIIQGENHARQHQPDLAAISNSDEASYMSWKYKGIFWGQDGEGASVSEAAIHLGFPATSVPKYDDLDQYTPVFDREPAPTSNAATPQYDDLDKYVPVKHNEPDGKPADHNEKTPYSDLHLYRPFMHNEPDGKPAGHIESSPAYDPEELAKYKPFLWNEPHGQPTTPMELGHEGHDPDEVQKYQPFFHNEPDGKPLDHVEAESAHSPEELAKYQPFAWNERHGQPKAPTEQSHEAHDSAELKQYRPFMHNEPDGKVADSFKAVDTAELSSYGPVRYQEPDGKATTSVDAVAESLKEFDLRSDGSSAEASDEVYSKILRRLESLNTLDGEKSALDSDFGASTRPASGKQSKDRARDREQLESSMTRMNADADTIDKMTSLSVKSIKSRAQRGMSEAQRQQAQVDPYSTEPQGLETSYAEECKGKATWPTYVKIHKAKTRADNAEEEVSSISSTTAEPALYKILAYNPKTQSINVAETSSAVPDMAQPLSPAEVLLRLSNPTKFFPHFKALEAQGYEMVSGSGDVLVFRKVRDVQAAVNPVDKTGSQDVSPPTANFASPTGYVNLDLPGTDSLPPSPGSRFKSNIGVRREEPVFSGPKAGKAGKADDTVGSKPSIAKRVVIGATWVAGVSYALGVVGEQVKASTTSKRL